MELDPDGPLMLTLPYLNIAICLLLALAAYVLKGRTADSKIPEGMWIFLLVPGIMLAMVTVARRSMIDSQEGIGGLEALKYGFKGA